MLPSNPAPIRNAMILAAGRGERMRPLSDATPKPLLAVGGVSFIERHVEAMARAGVDHIVINTAWLGEQIEAQLGDGSRWGVRIRYSREGQDYGGALETAGGIATAEPWAWPTPDEGDETVPDTTDGRGEATDCYWLVSGDIFCPAFEFDAAYARCFLSGNDLAHVWLVPNPPFHKRGDFVLERPQAPLAQSPSPAVVARAKPAASAAATALARETLTYANLALCRPTLTAGVSRGTRAPLGPLLFRAAEAGRVGGYLWSDRWENVGTPAQLAALDAEVRARKSAVPKDR